LDSHFNATLRLIVRIERGKSLSRQYRRQGLEPTPVLRGPDFESGASAIAVALETGCGGA
jgi:hypothetical protein